MTFLGADKSIVQRTQYFNYEVLNERPVKFLKPRKFHLINLKLNVYLFIYEIMFAPYFTMSNFSTVLKVIVGGLTFTRLANFKLGRKILLKVKLDSSFE
jgi:hypothetical protein